jgi:hypothetical protein
MPSRDPRKILIVMTSRLISVLFHMGIHLLVNVRNAGFPMTPMARSTVPVWETVYLALRKILGWVIVTMVPSKVADVRSNFS